MNRLLRLLKHDDGEHQGMTDTQGHKSATVGETIDSELSALRAEQVEMRAVVDLLQQVAMARGWVTSDEIAAVKRVERARDPANYTRSPNMAGTDDHRHTG